MKYKGFLFIFAAIVLAAAVPVQYDSQEALLQEALEDAASGRIKTASRTRITKEDPFHTGISTDKSEATAESDEQNLFLDIAGSVLDYVKKRASSNPSRVQRIPGNIHQARRQRFLPKEVQERYNTGDEEQNTAETEVFSSLLQLLSNFLPSGGTGNGSSSFVNLLLQLFRQFLTTNGNGGGNEEENVAEVEGFRSFLSNALKLVNRKLKPGDRTPEEDEEAVDDPTKWTDLGRNLIRTLQEKIDGTSPQTAEIESFSSLLQLPSGSSQNDGTGNNLSAFVNMLLQIFQQFLTANGNGGESEEESVAEIEGFRSFLSSALKLVNKKLKPSSRTLEEDDDAVNNPTKLTDLGRSLLRSLREKLDRPSQHAGGGETAEGATSTKSGYQLTY